MITRLGRVLVETHLLPAGCKNIPTILVNCTCKTKNLIKFKQTEQMYERSLKYV